MQTDGNLITEPKFSVLKQAIQDKVYYTKLFMTDILPKIAQISNQPRYGYHGLTHTTQVALFGVELSLASGAEPLPVMLAAGLHDCARTHDKDCLMHGPKCEPIAHTFLDTHYPTLSYQTHQQIVYAVVNHSRNIPAPDAVSACLWDGDRIRLAWELGYNPNFFATEYGRKIASLTPRGQAQYIARQERFLIQHGIKTRAQIDHENVMNAIFCATNTNFKDRVK